MKFYFWLLILIAFNSCTMKEKETATGINKFFDNYYEERLSYYPLEATQIADPRFNDTLALDISDSYRAKLKSFYQRHADELKKYDRSKLDEQQQVSYDVFEREMKMQLEGLTYKDNLMPVNQFWSMHLTFPQLGSGSGIQPFKTVKDYEDFLKRADDFSIYIDTAISNMRRGMAEKIVPPVVLMEKVLPQLSQIIIGTPEEAVVPAPGNYPAEKSEEEKLRLQQSTTVPVNEVTVPVSRTVFYGPVNNFPVSFSAEDKLRLKDAYSKSISEVIIPAYKKLYIFIKDEYIKSCRQSSGISDIPGGKELYNYLIRFWTTTDKTPDEIFNTGQEEVKRLREAMEQIKISTGFKGTLKEFFTYLHTDKKFMPFKTADEVINAYRNIETRMQPKLKELFNLVPKAKFEVRQTEKFREASASAEYNQSAPDGSRPGIFYVPVPDPGKFNVVGMEDLFLHEAIPGHHYQISLQQENDSLPKFRRFGWYGAYGEGWALYTESLGSELGLYTDPYQAFGRLSEEMHRAIRLVVDVGMHAKGWTREEAIKFSLENEAQSEADIIAEIERYMAIPAQALAYKTGQLKILELRHRAEEKLGDKFSIKAFHDEILKYGCLPLEVLERKVGEFISRESANRN
jgi:uncharacterized protein (DUF885 family)